VNNDTGPTAQAPPPAAAFFDLDRTLIKGASVMIFGHVAWKNGFVTNRELLSDAKNAVVFRMVGASDEKTDAVRDRILSAIAGSSRSEMDGLGDEILPRLLRRVRDETRAIVDQHRGAGRETWVVTASPVEIAGSLASALEMTGAIATEAAVDAEGVYTGDLAEAFCYGPGKAERIAKLAAERGYDLRLCYSYSDSISDLPMMELVGHPVAVNPDHALRAVALHRGWPIVEFSKRAKRVVKMTTATGVSIGLATATYVLGRSQGYRRGREAARWRFPRRS